MLPETAGEYLGALERLMLVENQEARLRNFGQGLDFGRPRSDTSWTRRSQPPLTVFFPMRCSQT